MSEKRGKNTFSSWHCLFVHNGIENTNMFFNWKTRNGTVHLIVKCSWTIDGTTDDFYLLLTLFECRFLLHFSPPRFCVIFFSFQQTFFLLIFCCPSLNRDTISWRLVVLHNKINSILFFFFIKEESRIEHEILEIIYWNASNFLQ